MRDALYWAAGFLIGSIIGLAVIASLICLILK